jgi:hypothetical protein
MVECLPSLGRGIKVTNSNPAASRINLDGFMLCANVYVLLLLKDLRGSLDQTDRVVDKLADSVGKTSSSIGYVTAAFESCDLEVGTSAAGICSSTHPGGTASYDNQPFTGHTQVTSSDRESVACREAACQIVLRGI